MGPSSADWPGLCARACAIALWIAGFSGERIRMAPEDGPFPESGAVKLSVDDEGKGDQWPRARAVLESVCADDEGLRGDEATPEPGAPLALIGSRAFAFHDEFDAALPGTPQPLSWTRRHEWKMARLFLVPDSGPTSESWYAPAEDPPVRPFDEAVFRIFAEALDGRMEPGSKAEGRGRSLYARLSPLLDARLPAEAWPLRSRLDRMLRRFLGLSPDHSLDDFGPDAPFGDYRPKASPDGLLDYAPRLREAFAALPPAEPSSAAALLSLLEEARDRADGRPGRAVPGNPLLGAAPEEWEPSDEELLEAEIGARLEEAVRLGGPRPAGTWYRAIGVSHADVMGSGRFFYASRPTRREIRTGGYDR